jgi:hypothetical protein
MTMKIIRNKFIPFPSYKCVNLFGVLFVRPKATISQRTINHEQIHTAQMKELGYIGFYLLYVLEWLYLFARCRNAHDAYHMISFEIEARLCEIHDTYLSYRLHYCWWSWFKCPYKIKKETLSYSI